MDKNFSELLKAIDYEMYKYFEYLFEHADITRDNKDKLYEQLDNAITDMQEIAEDLKTAIDIDINTYEEEYQDYKDYLWTKYHVKV